MYTIFVNDPKAAIWWMSFVIATKKNVDSYDSHSSHMPKKYLS